MKRQALDLFAGGGGASCGLQQAGFDVVAAIEADPQIAAIHHLNNPETELIVQDVRCTDFKVFVGIDHIHGSPPCQSFSVAASRQAKAKRIAAGEADLIFDWVRAIDECRPRTASLENVPGATKSPGFQFVCQILWEKGYWVNWEIYNAADFGVPQTRKRLILRAIRDDVLGTMPIERAEQTLFGEKRWWGLTPPKQKWIGWYEAIADLIPFLPETTPASWQLKRLSKELKCLINGKANNKFLVPRVGARSGELAARSQSHPAPTIRALGHSGHWRQLDAWLDFGEFRQITPRALARFQSFPDSFQLPTNSAIAGKIVGNAVPPLMLKKLIRKFA